MFTFFYTYNLTFTDNTLHIGALLYKDKKKNYWLLELIVVIRSNVLQYNQFTENCLS